MSTFFTDQKNDLNATRSFCTTILLKNLTFAEVVISSSYNIEMFRWFFIIENHRSSL